MTGYADPLPPPIAELIRLCDDGIRRWHKSIFQNRCFTLFNFGLALSNGIQAWATDCWWLFAATLISIASGVTCLLLNRRLSRRVATLHGLRRNAVLFYRSPNGLRAEFYADQVIAGLNNL